MRCSDALGNPFIHLQLGQCQFELGNEQIAADELTRAYVAEGNDIFEGGRVGAVPLWRIRADPPPGLATEEDVERGRVPRRSF